MDRQVVFDVGANNGDDAAHYLRRGFRVIAIEAAPQWVEHLRRRFEAPLRDGSMVLLDCAVADQEGSVTFHVAEQNRGIWSSLDSSRANRNGVTAREVTVRARTLTSIMAEYGTPFYLKVDIEGSDRICLEAVNAADAPQYVSFEATESELSDLYALAAKGYQRFRLVDQTTFARVPPPALHTLEALVPSAVHLARQVVRSRRSAPPPPAAPRSREFEVSSSGPMPHEHPGAWDTLDGVTLAWLYYVKNAGVGRWFDVHAAR